MMLAIARRHDPDRDRARAITDRYNARNLEIFREAMKNRGKSQEEIDRLSEELAEKQQPRRP
jgi:hypothetical protein